MRLPGTRNPECRNEINDFKTCGSANSQTEFINKSDCINERNDETFSQCLGSLVHNLFPVVDWKMKCPEKVWQKVNSFYLLLYGVQLFRL